MTTVHTQGNITNLRGDINREAALRVWDVGGALRVHLNNLSLSGLREYIALSRHQFELTEFVCERTGQSGGGGDGPESVPVMNYRLGRHELVPFRRRGIEALPPTPGWELEMLDDMAWRARAIGAVLHRLGPQIPVRSADDHAELSRHQCEIVDFMTTGSFRKVPRRRKARTLSGGAVTPESAERIKQLGEALQEYQGRITIKTVREFIALSKHQCELAGLLFASASGEGKEPVFQVVGYPAEAGQSPSGVAGSEADGNDVGRSPLFGKEGQGEISSIVERRQNPPQSPFSKGGSNSAGSGLCPEPHISERQLVEGSGTAVHGQGFVDREISGAGLPVPGYKLGTSRSRPAPAKEATFLGHIIGLYPDGSARVRVDIPGYPSEVDIPADCVPPGGGPVEFHLTPQGPMLYASGVEDDAYEEWDDGFP